MGDQSLERGTHRQIGIFAVAGGVQLLVDWLCFVALTWIGLPVVSSNIAGRGFGAILGFWLNGRFTFNEGGVSKTGRTHALRFVIGWLTTAALSTLAVHALADHQSLALAWIGKPLVDVLIAALGFLLSKYWIFR